MSSSDSDYINIDSNGNSNNSDNNDDDDSNEDDNDNKDFLKKFCQWILHVKNRNNPQIVKYMF